MKVSCCLIFSPKALHIFCPTYSVAIVNDWERYSLCCLCWPQIPGLQQSSCLSLPSTRIAGVYNCARLLYLVVKICVCISQLDSFLFCSCELGGALWCVAYIPFSHQFAFFFCFMNAGLDFINCSTISVHITIWFSPTNEIEYVTMYSTIDQSFRSLKRPSLVTVLFYFAKLPDWVCKTLFGISTSMFMPESDLQFSFQKLHLLKFFFYKLRSCI